MYIPFTTSCRKQNQCTLVLHDQAFDRLHIDPSIPLYMAYFYISAPFLARAGRPQTQKHPSELRVLCPFYCRCGSQVESGNSIV